MPNREKDYNSVDYEQVIINKTINGDNEAFSYIIDKYKNYIYTIITRNNFYNEDADDLFQTIFLKIIKNLQKYNKKFLFKNWIFTIALNHIRNHKKRLITSYLKNNKLNNSSETEGDYPNMDDTIDKTIYEKQLNSELSKLPKKYFKVIMMFYFENQKYEEIAQAMNKPVGTIKTYLFRAKNILSKKLKHLEKFFV